MYNRAWFEKKTGKKPKARPQKEEHQIQVGLFDWKQLQQNKYPALRNLFAIPNGGSRNGIEASNLKAEGVCAGVPDTLLAYPSDGFCGLFIEHKTKKGSLTKDQPIKCKKTGLVRYIREGQSTWFKRLAAAGYRCEVSRSTEQSINVIKEYLGI